MKQRWMASGVAVRLGWAAVVLLSIGSGSCGPEGEAPPEDDDTVSPDDDTLPPDDDTVPPDDDTLPPDDDTTEGEDRDGDGYSPPEDCNDYSSTSYPGAPELCDELDNDCNGIVEDNIDADGDGRSVCDDCDDTDPLVHPGASDVWCDGIDQDCISGDLCGPASWVSLELAEARIDGGERVTDCYPYEEVAVGIGDSLAGVGDVDGDGFADFAVGNEDVFGFDCVVGSGGAFIFRGPISGVHSVFEAFGAVLGRPVPPPYGDGAGQALAGGEDLTGDGVPDLLVGASLMNEEGFEAGGAILVSG
ncbi:hypothetical protein L6R50_27880, partial [Myxococcota bacterium]|nr:hypothetical protein [Myxococcota bacterium]